MSKMKYSEELANFVKEFLVEDDWHFSFDESIGVFEFGLRIDSKIHKIEYAVDVKEDEIIVYGLCPIIADSGDADMMARMAEFLCRVNYGLKNGCFELNFQNGEGDIRFRSYIDCEDSMPSNKVFRNSIYCTAAMFLRYATGIVDIVFSDCTAEEALAKCRKTQREELRSEIMKMAGEDTGILNIDEVIDSMVEQFHNPDAYIQEFVDSSANTADEVCVNPFAGKKEGGETT